MIDSPIRLIPLALALTLVAGCSGAPHWIDEPPQESGYLYATGSYFGALYPEENAKNALEAAIERLSGLIQTQVDKKSRGFTNDTSSGVSETTETRATGVVDEWEMVASWRDDEGTRSAPGTEWVLIRAPIPD